MPTRETPTHSPGPWTTDGYGVYDATKQIIAEVYVDVHSRDADAAEANRRLILKSWQLLAACRVLVLKHESGMGEVDRESTYETMKALVDAIDGTGAE
jgi:hypothetical protein